MEMTIKSVVTRTEFSAAQDGIRLEGNYEMNTDNELQQLSAAVHESDGVVRGNVRGYRRGGQMLYDYSGMSNAMTTAVSALVEQINARLSGAAGEEGGTE